MSSNLRRRRAAASPDADPAPANNPDDKKEKATKQQPGFERKKSHLRSKKFPILPFLGLMLVAGAILYPAFQRYGVNMFIDRSYYDLNYTAAEWNELLSDKTLLLLGGPHRSGTSMIWKTIKAHPDVSGFGSSHETGVDESEGILIQPGVYSRYGVGMEDMMKNDKRYENQMLGVGRYALGKKEDVHLLETDPRVTDENMASILNRFGQYWNLSKPVLTEKSPPTIVMSRFLQAMYNPKDDKTKGGPTVKFLFMTRHPIANFLAHENMVGAISHLTYDILMKNYIQVHRYLMEDLPYLQNDPMIVRLEDFTADPAGYLTKIYTWLGLDASEEMVKYVLEERLGEKIRPTPNEKYRARWCGTTTAKNQIMPVHQRQMIVEKYQRVIKDELARFGYDLKSWCE